MPFKTVTEICLGVEAASDCNVGYRQGGSDQQRFSCGQADGKQILVWGGVNGIYEQFIKIGGTETAVFCDLIHCQRFHIKLLQVFNGSTDGRPAVGDHGF